MDTGAAQRIIRECCGEVRGPIMRSRLLRRPWGGERRAVPIDPRTATAHDGSYLANSETTFEECEASVEMLIVSIATREMHPPTARVFSRSPVCPPPPPRLWALCPILYLLPLVASYTLSYLHSAFEITPKTSFLSAPILLCHESASLNRSRFVFGSGGQQPTTSLPSSQPLAPIRRF